MHSFLVSIGLVALAEIGDKTQLLSLILSARFRKPIPIILGILAATVLNHAFAGAIGSWLSRLIGMQVLSWILTVSFLAMSVWILIPDKVDETTGRDPDRFGVFWTTFAAFFLAEMGDKTQIATVALAARYQDLFAVVLGTTVGMMLANVPVVYLGDKLSRKLPLKPIRILTSVLFLVLGIFSLLRSLGKF